MCTTGMVEIFVFKEFYSYGPDENLILLHAQVAEHLHNDFSELSIIIYLLVNIILNSFERLIFLQSFREIILRFFFFFLL